MIRNKLAGGNRTILPEPSDYAGDVTFDSNCRI